MDVTACIPGDIIKPGDKLANIPRAPEGTNYENHTILEQFYSMFKTGVCSEYGLWIKFLHMDGLPNMPSSE